MFSCSHIGSTKSPREYLLSVWLVREDALTDLCQVNWCPIGHVFIKHPCELHRSQNYSLVRLIQALFANTVLCCWFTSKVKVEAVCVKGGGCLTCRDCEMVELRILRGEAGKKQDHSPGLKGTIQKVKAGTGNLAGIERHWPKHAETARKAKAHWMLNPVKSFTSAQVAINTANKFGVRNCSVFSSMICRMGQSALSANLLIKQRREVAGKPEDCAAIWKDLNRPGNSWQEPDGGQQSKVSCPTLDVE